MASILSVAKYIGLVAVAFALHAAFHQGAKSIGWWAVAFALHATFHLAANSSFGWWALGFAIRGTFRLGAKSFISWWAVGFAVHATFRLGCHIIGHYFRSRNNPPSPPSWRLWGHFLPHTKSFITISNWINQYGPVITIRSGFKNIVIIGNYTAAERLMVDQCQFFADRPCMIAIGEILSGGLSLLFVPFSTRSIRMRRAIVSYFERDAPDEPQHQMAKNIVLRIIDDSCNFHNHTINESAAMILEMTYGKNCSKYTGMEARMMRRVRQTFRTAMRGSYQLVEWIPWLRHLPRYKNLKRDFHTSRRVYANQLLRNRNVTGPSFAKHLIDNSECNSEEKAFLAGNLLLTGCHLMSSAICTVMIAAARFLDEQEKVQAEINSVVECDRAPTFSDLKDLPLLRAFVVEALRWRPVVPNGIPHQTTDDVKWGGFCIPDGTTVIGNHYAISRDAERYPEPDAFKPQRWTEEMMHSDHKFFLYGFGKRACPVQNMANRSIFLSAALCLWAFEIRAHEPEPEIRSESVSDADLDMAFMIENGTLIDDECCTAPASAIVNALDFRFRIPNSEVRRMLTS